MGYFNAITTSGGKPGHVMYVHVYINDGSTQQFLYYNSVCICDTYKRYAPKKNLLCTVHFTRPFKENGSQTTIERILNGPRTGAERTVHGPFRFTYVRTTRVLQLNFMRVQRMYVSVADFKSCLLVCNREVERDPVLKP